MYNGKSLELMKGEYKSTFLKVDSLTDDLIKKLNFPQLIASKDVKSHLRNMEGNTVRSLVTNKNKANTQFMLESQEELNTLKSETNGNSVLSKKEFFNNRIKKYKIAFENAQYLSMYYGGFVFESVILELARENHTIEIANIGQTPCNLKKETIEKIRSILIKNNLDNEIKEVELSPYTYQNYIEGKDLLKNNPYLEKKLLEEYSEYKLTMPIDEEAKNKMNRLYSTIRKKEKDNNDLKRNMQIFVLALSGYDIAEDSLNDKEKNERYTVQFEEMMSKKDYLYQYVKDETTQEMKPLHSIKAQEKIFNKAFVDFSLGTFLIDNVCAYNDYSKKLLENEQVRKAYIDLLPNIELSLRKKMAIDFMILRDDYDDISQLYATNDEVSNEPISIDTDELIHSISEFNKLSINNQESYMLDLDSIEKILDEYSDSQNYPDYSLAE